MHLRACIALLFCLSACATSAPSPRARVKQNPRIANLQRAATLPWRDGGRCVVQESSQPWPVLVERCFHALDQGRVRFHDTTGRCSVASVDAAALGLGFCVLAAPEIAVGAVIVVGVVVVGVVIKGALEAYELSGSSREEVEPALQTKPAPQESSTNRKPKPEPSGQDWFPPVPTEPMERERRPECSPVPVPHAGGDPPHNECADKFPPNRYPGKDVLVGGKRFDALQVGVRVLWEIKTDQFDTYNAFLQGQVVREQAAKMREERNIAPSCGYGFVVGVSTEAHKDALERAAPELELVVTGCKR
ncbi:hypothetical protein D7X74_09890 [Corallococcus sp. CA047B]|uniref:DUF6310 domain-containing protein n=1 Tax=Corallococcus sp. CA047B TaxID=2316729 RepID=UPI000EA0C3B6|nr:DUF6310 domain-containing protein [Corallococcus sp. CA047B]RKH18366.1 hypothetical protein D7X74_09890 [Corallococcus sp. CA047B]